MCSMSRSFFRPTTIECFDLYRRVVRGTLADMYGAVRGNAALSGPCTAARHERDEDAA